MLEYHGTASSRRKRRSLHLLAVALISVTHAAAFQFYLQAGEKRCFTEQAAPNAKVLGEYTVSTGKGSMPVDIVVRIQGHNRPLYERHNADHGKFAFVIPFDDSDVPHVQKAEMHRKLQKAVHERARRHAEGIRAQAKAEAAFAHSSHRRKLLTVDDHGAHHDHHDDHYHHDDHDHHDHHDDHDHHDHHDYHDHYDHHDDHDHHHDHDHHYDDDHLHHDDHDHHHDHDHHDDEDEYDYEDDLDDFDEEDYAGIDDEELDEEVERHAQREEKLHGRLEDASDEDQEDRLFELKRFEICVENRGDKTGHRRRVRLVVHKGDTAHDYTRLAKKEHLSQLEVSLRQVSGELHELMHELDQARLMEDILRKLNEDTNKRVVVLGIISLFSLFAVGGYQAFYTKRFFKQKKIL